MLFHLLTRFFDTDPAGGGNPSPAPVPPAETMIPKYRFDEINQKYQASEQKLAEYVAKDAEYSKKDEKIAALEKELADTKASYEKEQNDAKRMDAIKKGLGDSVQDVDVMLKLIDLDKVTIDDSGKLTGLSEQIETLKKDKPFLFKAAPNPVDPNGNGNKPAEKSFAAKLAEKKASVSKTAAKGAKDYFG